MIPEDVPPGPLLVDTDVIRYWVTGAQPGPAFEALTVGRELAISFATYGELLAIGHRARFGPSRLEDLRNRMRSFVGNLVQRGRCRNMGTHAREGLWASPSGRSK